MDIACGVPSNNVLIDLGTLGDTKNDLRPEVRLSEALLTRSPTFARRFQEAKISPI